MAVITILEADEDDDWARAVAADPWSWSGKGREPSDGWGVLSCSGATAVRQKKGVWTVSTPWASYRCRIGPDCGSLRGSGGFPRAGTRFEFHLGHNIPPRQRGFLL